MSGALRGLGNVCSSWQLSPLLNCRSSVIRPAEGRHIYTGSRSPEALNSATGLKPKIVPGPSAILHPAPKAGALGRRNSRDALNDRFRSDLRRATELQRMTGFGATSPLAAVATKDWNPP